MEMPRARVWNLLLVLVVGFATAAIGWGQDPVDLSNVRLAWPLIDGEGRITRGFGPAIDPETGDWYIHDGVAIAALSHTPVLCVLPGIVKSAGMAVTAPSGGFVVIEHLDGAMRTVYQHLSRITVTEGQRLETGDRIGLVGSTGSAVDNELGFKVIIEDCSADPMWFLQDSMPQAVREWCEARYR
jgi:murein DD-endopeptidase MepM/ murein hydrolase activator NlpD